MTTPAIRTVGLCRTFRRPHKWRKPAGPAAPAEFTALDDVGLEVQPGELFGLLGANGAGKSTLIKVLTTLLAPTGGTAHVDGLDVVSQADRLRERINLVSGGETSGYGVLTARENLWLFSQLYGVPGKEARQRIANLLDAVGLAAHADVPVSRLSTGQRQRMNFCRGFVTDPRVLFLDEPTLGLDVTAARAARQFVRDWLAARPDRTLLLTTHYLAEADELCDRVAVLHHGRVLACDCPEALKRLVQCYPTFELTLAPGHAGTVGWHGLGRLPGVQHCAATEGPETAVVRVALHEEAAVAAVVQETLADGARLLLLRKVEPTLEDVFLDLVGGGPRPEGGEL
jgi:ABC-2 type transport system ATP-binding protein